jgi:hypothetical protein
MTTVTTQQELDAALKAGAPEVIINSPAGVRLEVHSTGSSSVEAWGSSRVVAWGSSSVVARDSSRVEAWDSSSVVARGSSSVEARDSSSVEAWDSSRVVAWGSSSVEAWGSSSVVARGSSSVEAWDSSRVEARDSSSVEAWGSSRVVARGSSSVEARGSSSVEAWDSSSVEAWGSSSVEAWDSSRVEAWGSSRVVAWGSSSVVARGSSSVVARGSSSVEASKYVAVHLHSGRATIEGGVVIDITQLDLDGHQDWADYHGVKTEGGELIVYKAVNADLKSGRGFAYPIGETVTDPAWKPGNFCGGGLHFSPSPAQAKVYFTDATRFLKCAVKTDELSIIDGADTYETPKLKAKSARVLCEVDIHGEEI